jgi:hypothetical protein
MKPGPLAVAAALLAVLPESALGTVPATEGSFERGRDALAHGRLNDAIVELERSSDLGMRDQNLSFNRGLAYLGRAESGNGREGDFGQAAAGFREAMLLGDDSEETREALDQVRHEISRRRAQKGLDPVVVRPALGRALAQLLPENVWSVAALVSSLGFAVGLALQRRGDDSPRSLAGRITTYAGFLLLLVSSAFAWYASRSRQEEKEAVVITTEAAILDEKGVRGTSRALDVDASAIPEGASIFVVEQRGRLARVHWGSTEAWVEIGQLRFIDRDLEL